MTAVVEAAIFRFFKVERLPEGLAISLDKPAVNLRMTFSAVLKDASFLC